MISAIENIINCFIFKHSGYESLFTSGLTCFISESYPAYDDTGQYAYTSACKRYNALPVSTLYRKLANPRTSDIDMKYYGTGATGARALAIPVVVSIEHFFFSTNNIEQFHIRILFV